MKFWEDEARVFDEMELSPANYRDWKNASRSFESIGAYHWLDVNMIGKGEPSRLEGAAVSADLFPTLRRSSTRWDGHSPPPTTSSGAPRTVILSYRLWQNDFAGDRRVVGQQLDLDNALVHRHRRHAAGLPVPGQRRRALDDDEVRRG